MIQIWCTAEQNSFIFEVVVREGKRGDSSPRHDVARDVRAAEGGLIRRSVV
jgi:hypothetical protein